MDGKRATGAWCPVSEEHDREPPPDDVRELVSSPRHRAANAHGPKRTGEFARAIGASIREARRTADISTNELARRSGVPREHITRAESGRVEMGIANLVRIARAFDEPLVIELPGGAVVAISAEGSPAPHGG